MGTVLFFVIMWRYFVLFNEIIRSEFKVLSHGRLCQSFDDASAHTSYDAATTRTLLTAGVVVSWIRMDTVWICRIIIRGALFHQCIIRTSRHWTCEAVQCLIVTRFVLRSQHVKYSFCIASHFGANRFLPQIPFPIPMAQPAQPQSVLTPLTHWNLWLHNHQHLGYAEVPVPVHYVETNCGRTTWVLCLTRENLSLHDMMTQPVNPWAKDAPRYALPPSTDLYTDDDSSDSHSHYYLSSSSSSDWDSDPLPGMLSFLSWKVYFFLFNLLFV